MPKWLKNFLTPKVEYIIVEVERPRPITDLKKMKDGEAAVASLEGHPGFQFLLAKFKIAKALLEKTIRSEPPTDLTRVGFLQQGIYWSGWLEQQLVASKAHQERTAPSTSSEELRVFNEIQAAMTKVA